MDEARARARSPGSWPPSVRSHQARKLSCAGSGASRAELHALNGGGSAPIRLLIEQNENYREVPVQWNGGLRYPHLERTGKGPSSFDALLAAK